MYDYVQPPPITPLVYMYSFSYFEHLKLQKHSIESKLFTVISMGKDNDSKKSNEMLEPVKCEEAEDPATEVSQTVEGTYNLLQPKKRRSG